MRYAATGHLTSRHPAWRRFLTTDRTDGGVGEVATRFFTFGSAADPVPLAAGGTLDEVTLAYETYGALDPDGSNAVLLFHALSGSQHAAGVNRGVPGVGGRWTEEMRLGWWDRLIGPGRAIDTDRWFVVCANYIGGCYGSSGPTSTNPATALPYGQTFPAVGFCDMVDAELRLLRHLGVERVHAAIGGSTGGLMALSLATRYPDRVGVVIPVAAGLAVTSLQVVHNFEQITAITSDPAFAGGNYGDEQPAAGLALARMIGHKTFVSLSAMRTRARHEIVEGSLHGYHLRHPLESYMRHQGAKFVERFDANSYLRIMEAWQSVDLLAEAGAGDWDTLFAGCRHQRWVQFSIDSDVCFYPEEQTDLAAALSAAGVPNRLVEVASDKGHDAFLVETERFAEELRSTLDGGW